MEQVTHPENFVLLSEKNLSVFPIDVARKTPAHDWKEYQSNIADPFTINEWAQSFYNIGIATGTVSRVFVLDCDAVEVFEWLIAHRELPQTPTVHTPRGYHLYFTLPDFPVKNAAGLHKRDPELPEGLDIRGDGGFVMAPGSYFIPTVEEMAEGKLEGAYYWVDGLSIDDLAPAPAPAWLLDLLRPKPLPVYDASYEPVAIGDSYAASAFAAEIANVEGARTGTRADTTFKSSAALGNLIAAGALDRGETERALVHAAQIAGLSASEAQHNVKEGISTGMRTPRVLMKESAPEAIPTPDDIRAQIATEKTPEPAPEPLKGFSAADAPNLETPEQEWVIEDFIPRGHVTTLFGDGGVGKSLLVQTMGSHIAAGESFADRDTLKMRVAAIMCEDDETELLRREQRIVARYWDGEAEAVRGFTLHSRVGEDNALGFLNPQKLWEKTAFFAQLEAFIADEKIEVLILDNIAQMFAGEQNENRPVTLFCNTLTGLAQKMNGAVIILGHVPKAGGNYSGSAAWNNAVRSRLFLSKGAETEPHNLRRLSVEKSNYGASGISIDLMLHDGVLVDPAAIDEADLKREAQKLDKAKAVIIEMLRREGSLSLKHQSPAYIRSDDRMALFMRAGIFDHRTIKDAVADLMTRNIITKRNETWGSSKGKKERIVLRDREAEAEAKFSNMMEGARSYAN